MFTKLNEYIFDSKKEMVSKMEPFATKYEGYIPGRNGYNFPSKNGTYTIAYIKGDMLTKKHEMSHAMFYFDPEYRLNAQKLFDSLAPHEQNIIEIFLKRCGYKSEHFLDEFAAYALTEENPEKFFGLKKKRLRQFIETNNLHRMTL